MAGLGSNMMQAGTPAQQQQPMQQSQPPMDDKGGMDTGGSQQPASPEEQAALEQFVRAAQDVIYPSKNPGKVFPQIVNDLKGQFDQQAVSLFDGADPPINGSPPDSVAATSVLILLVVDQQFGLLKRALERGGQQQPMENEPNEEQPGQPEEDRTPEATGEDEQDFSPEAVLYQAGAEIVEELIEVSEALKLHDFQDEETQGVFLRALDLFRVAASKVSPGVINALKQDFSTIVDADRSGQLNKILPGLPGGQPMPASQQQPGQQGA